MVIFLSAHLYERFRHSMLNLAEHLLKLGHGSHYMNIFSRTSHLASFPILEKNCYILEIPLQFDYIRFQHTICLINNYTLQ